MVELGVDPRKSICSQCGPQSEVVLDESAGDMICTNCGLVLDSRCIDQGVEWRSFAVEGVENGQRVNERERADRCDIVEEGSALQPSGTTIIGGSDAISRSLMKAHNMASYNAERSQTDEGRQEMKVKAITGRIRDMTSRLALGEEVVRRSVCMLEKLAEKGELKQKLEVAWLCGLIHLASSEERATRTTGELAEANAGVAGKKVKDLEKIIEKRVKELRMQLDIIEPPCYAKDEELLERFVNRLQLARGVCKPASHISKMAFKHGLVELMGRKMPQTAIVASSIFIVAWLLDVAEKPTFTDVATIAKISEALVRKAYGTLHAHIRRLLPEDFVCSLDGGVKGLPLPPP